MCFFSCSPCIKLKDVALNTFNFQRTTGNKAVFSTHKNIMELTSILQNEIKALIKLQIELDESNGPEMDEPLFDNYCHLRRELLSKFGLPDSDVFGKLLFKKKEPSDEEILLLIDNLKIAASDYLKKPTESEELFLERAVQERLSPFIVLPELKILTHTYTIFVYERILLANLDNTADVLKALRLASESGSLNSLGILEQSEHFGEAEMKMVTDLKERGIKYIDEFLEKNLTD